MQLLSQDISKMMKEVAIEDDDDEEDDEFPVRGLVRIHAWAVVDSTDGRRAAACTLSPIGMLQEPEEVEEEEPEEVEEEEEDSEWETDADAEEAADGPPPEDWSTQELADWLSERGYPCEGTRAFLLSSVQAIQEEEAEEEEDDGPPMEDWSTQELADWLSERGLPNKGTRAQLLKSAQLLKALQNALDVPEEEEGEEVCYIPFNVLLWDWLELCRPLTLVLLFLIECRSRPSAYW